MTTPTLPYDIARCAGVGDENGWREGCDVCLRRLSAGREEQQSYIEPPAVIAFFCEFYIGG